MVVDVRKWWRRGERDGKQRGGKGTAAVALLGLLLDVLCIPNYSHNFIAVTTRVGRRRRTSIRRKDLIYISYYLYKPSYSLFCLKFCCRGNRGWLWWNLSGIIQQPGARISAIFAFYSHNIVSGQSGLFVLINVCMYISRVIDYFVSNFVTRPTRVVRRKI